MSENKPVIYLECWQAKTGIHWSERSFQFPTQFKQFYDYTHMFNGEAAIVYVGTSDYEITRDEMLDVAEKHVTGDCVTMYFDLSSLSVKVLDGIPPTPTY
jgi:hypothetical protein